MIRRPMVLALLLNGLLLLVATSGQAGTSRAVSLGGDADYFTDSANVSRWYSSLTAYPNQVDIELGDVLHGQDTALSNEGFVGHGGGVHIRLDEDGSYGTAAFYVQDNLRHGPSDGAFSVYWARRFGALHVGLGGSFSTYGISQIGPVIGDRTDSQYFHQYGLGLGYEISSRLRLELAGEIVNSMTAGAGATYSLPLTDDWDTFGFRLRGFWDVSDQLTLLPLVDYVSDVRSGLDLSGDRPVDIDLRVLKLGAGANFQVNPDLFLVFSSEYSTGRNNLNWDLYNAGSDLFDSAHSDFYQVRLRTGVEATLLSWLTVRAAVKYVRDHEEKFQLYGGTLESYGTYYTENVFTPVVLGAGFYFGDLTADFAYNDSPPLAELGFGGESSSSRIDEGYSSVTLSWKF